MADLYFTSDTHSYLYPTDYISPDRKNMGYISLSSLFKDGAIIADGGDVLQGSPLVRYEIRNGIRPFLASDVFNRAGLSIYVPGNHDFNFGYETLCSFLKSLKAEKLAANLVDERGELGVKPYTIRETEDGLKLLFVGVITDYVGEGGESRRLEDYRLRESCRRSIERGNESFPGFYDLHLPWRLRRGRG